MLLQICISILTILKVEVVDNKSPIYHYQQIDNNFRWSLLLSTIEMPSKCSKIQVEPRAGDERFHCKILNILTSFLWSIMEETDEDDVNCRNTKWKKRGERE